ncbi:MAG: DsbA family protein [Methyloligellaceae bacterium]
MSSKNIIVTAVVVAATVVGAQYLYQMLNKPSGNLNKGEVEKIVRDYLLKKPEVIEEAMLIRRRNQLAEQQAQQKEAVAKNSEQLFKASHDFVAGNPEGDVTIVEFFDYNCGFCRRAFNDIAKVIEADKNIRVVFKELPIFGEQSEQAARAAIASIQQNKYFEFHRDMLVEPGRANEAKALKIAEKLGMDIEKLKTDMKSPSVTKALKANSDLANNIGLDGTPLYVVGDEIINGAPEDLADQILTRVASIRNSRKK